MGKRRAAGAHAARGGAETGLNEAAASAEQSSEPVDTPEQTAYKEGYAAAKAEFAAAQAQLASRVEETLAHLNKALDSAERNLDQQAETGLRPFFYFSLIL